MKVEHDFIISENPWHFYIKKKDPKHARVGCGYRKYIQCNKLFEIAYYKRPVDIFIIV